MMNKDGSTADSPEKSRTRVRKRKVNYAADGDDVYGLTCTISSCGLSFGCEAELESHYNIHLCSELTSLERVRVRPARKPNVRSSLQDLRNQTYCRLKERRERRRIQSQLEVRGDRVLCQVCLEEVHGALENHQEHVRACLKAPSEEAGQSSQVDDDHHEEYEWAGQSRVRAVSFVSGRFNPEGACVVARTDETEHVDVTDDDVQDDFGPVQFTEDDLVRVRDAGPSTSFAASKTVNSATKDNFVDKSVILEDETEITIGNNIHLKTDNTVKAKISDKSVALKTGKEQESMKELQEDQKDETLSKESSFKAKLSPEDNKGQTKDLEEQSLSDVECEELASLKGKLAELRKEVESLSETSVCRICMDRYSSHVISTVCWHVHCQQCWMLTLATKKLCPQCKAIVKPSDLRKIYL